MNKNVRLKLIITIIVTLCLLMSLMTTTVFADGQLDLDSITGGDATEGTTEDEEIPDLTPEIETEKESETEDVTEEEPESTSKYEENKIPHAGTEDTALMVTAFIVLGIIGIYTFIKLSEYSNI